MGINEESLSTPVDREALSEYRIYVANLGGLPVLDVRGEQNLQFAIESVRKRYPGTTIFVREVLETVILVLKPGEKPILLNGGVPEN